MLWSFLTTLLPWIFLQVGIPKIAGVTTAEEFEWKDSSIEALIGHYPSVYCKITNVVFNSSDGNFYYQGSTEAYTVCQREYFHIWDVLPHPDPPGHIGCDSDATCNDDSPGHITCDAVYDVGHVFTFYYIYHSSNYFHLHYDMMIPLYQAIYHNRNPTTNVEKIALMPSVETKRLQRISWDVPAFKDEDKYWVTTIKMMAKESDLLPLNKNLRMEGKIICFKEIYFGTPKVPFRNEKELQELIPGFIKFIKSQLGLNVNYIPQGRPKVGIISRSSRRRILNEVELVEAISDLADVDLLKFENMSVREQIRIMQEYTVVAGMNGAGLMNTLYLPRHAVAVQLVPYQAVLNFEQFGKLLKARGPYMEWHNMHQNLTHEKPKAKNSHAIDTIVHTEEFYQLIKDALKLAAATLRESRREDL